MARAIISEQLAIVKIRKYVMMAEIFEDKNFYTTYLWSIDAMNEKFYKTQNATRRSRDSLAYCR